MALQKKWTFETAGDGKFPIGVKRYRELMDSGTSVLNENSASAQRVFLVDWDEQAEFLDDLLGYSEFNPDGSINRITPEEHGFYYYFYAVEASVTPKGGKTTARFEFTDSGNSVGVSEWPCAKITVTYRPLKWLVKEDDDPLLYDKVGRRLFELNRYVERVPIQVKADYLTVNNQFRFVSTPPPKAPLASSPGIITPSLSVKYTWRQIPAIRPDPDNPFLKPNSEMQPPNLLIAQKLLGKTNKFSFDGYKPQTVLFLDYEPNLILPKLSDGRFYWNITYTFHIRDNGPGLLGPGGVQDTAGVNYIFSTVASTFSQYDLVTDNGEFTGRRIYQPADDFDNLFNFIL